MKILYISNFVKTYSLVFKNELSVLKELGHEVEWAANFTWFIGDTSSIPFKTYNVPFRSNPIHFNNIKAYLMINDILKNGNYDAIICSTPIGGTIGRLAGKKQKIKKVVYCAHGFLFFKGINKFLYWAFYNHEKILSKYTDHMITITDEDYAAAKNFNLRNNGSVNLVHGAGVDFDDNKISHDDILKKRQEIGINEQSAYILISAGQLNKNKNNKVVINALSILKNPNVWYVICGEGPYKDKLEKLAQKKNVINRVIFLGYRTDVEDLMLSSNAFIMPSFREGAPRSLLEAINSNLPCIGSNVRGISDILMKGDGGLLCNPHCPNEFANAINILVTDKEKSNNFILTSKKNISKYSSETVISELHNIYSDILK